MRFIVKCIWLSTLHCFRISNIVKLIRHVGTILYKRFCDYICNFLIRIGAVKFTFVSRRGASLDRCFNQENSPSGTAYLRFHRSAKRVTWQKRNRGFARLRTGLKSMWKRLCFDGCCYTLPSIACVIMFFLSEAYLTHLTSGFNSRNVENYSSSS